MMSRVEIMKTYKLFINGAFVRSESGRSYEIKNSKNKFLANPAQASRKDLRDAVSAAKNAFTGWSEATGYNRGQILYRIAEMLEGRREQFITEITLQSGVSRKQADLEVSQAIDLWVWYAGWCDKLSSICGNQNQIAASFYNFTTPEPLGTVAIFPSQKSKSGTLIAIVAALAPVICAGNTAILIAPQTSPLTAMSLAEVLATSDLPAGVANILTGKSAELISWVGSHMEIDGVDCSGLSKADQVATKVSGAENLKRIHKFTEEKSTERILKFMEQKTVWQPIGI
jgi:acyl-CoA reductase-like NAD-dependent aldehyde dehydrogenase